MRDRRFSASSRRSRAVRPAVLLFLLIVTCAATVLAAQQLTVQVRETQLRERPSYLGSGIKTVTYGMRLSVLAEQGPWRKVATLDGRQGWLHISVLSEKRLRLQSGETDVAGGTDLDEIALAGKGFTEEVEQVFRENNEDVDFVWVDRMIGWVLTPEEAAAFLASGEVEPREGGVR